MATFKITFYEGFNYISIPLDLTGGSYEDDPKILFNPGLMTQFFPNTGFTGDYVFKSIYSVNYSLYNNNGEWEGNTEWDSISSSEGLIVFCNTPESNRGSTSRNNLKVKNPFFIVSFHGDTIADPSTIQYDLIQGWNLVSYPYLIAQHFGEGDYTTDTAIDFIMNTNYLAGSGHADSCIDKVLQKVGGGVNHVYSLDYDGAGDDSTDWIQGDGANKLEIIKPGFAFWVHSTADKSNSTLWDNSTNIDDSNYNHLQGTTGVTTAQTDGNRGLNTWSVSGSGVNPDYSKEQFVFEIKTINNSGEETSFKIKDSSGNNILNATGTGSSNTRIIVTDGVTDYEAGFFVERLFNQDENRPNWGCRGYFSAIVHDNQMLTAYHSETPIGGYGMEHYGNIPSMGITVSDLPMFTAGVSGAGGGIGMNKFSDLNGMNMPYMGITISLVRDTLEQGLDLLPANKITTGFQVGDFIIPVIYDPTKDDGDRYRYCKYYPHVGDKYHAQGWKYFREEEAYRDLFYNEDGTFKFDPIYGEPYLEPVYKKIPYAIMNTDSLTWKHIQSYLGGIIQML
jgi:hypothetical protein